MLAVGEIWLVSVRDQHRKKGGFSIHSWNLDLDFLAFLIFQWVTLTLQIDIPVGMLGS